MRQTLILAIIELCVIFPEAFLGQFCENILISIKSYSLPPGFEHQCAIGESEPNLSEPYSQCAGDNVRPGIQHEGLQTKTHYRFAFNLCVNILFL